MGKAKEIFNDQEVARLKKSIVQAELHTSGEIRLHIENTCKEKVLDRAAQVFQDLQMHKTALRNGVLFYLSVVDRKFAILGDVGINQKVPKNFWDQIKTDCIAAFKAGHLVEGLEKGIVQAGKALSDHFPYERNDINELSNEISFGE